MCLTPRTRYVTLFSLELCDFVEEALRAAHARACSDILELSQPLRVGCAIPKSAVEPQSAHNPGDT
jgi:hypothetical protein